MGNCPQYRAISKADVIVEVPETIPSAASMYYLLVRGSVSMTTDSKNVL